MGSPQDTEITLGTGKLLFLFFGLVGICALFFALGYSLGRKSEPVVSTASAGTARASSNPNKGNSGSAAAPMTFYKNVEQKDASPELTPPADTKTDGKNDGTAAASGSGQAAPANATENATALPTSGYFVQVAAVSKQDDADALVDALKKRDYPAFVASATSADKLFRVQLGPFSEIKDAEGVRTKLIGDGYSPILKK